MISAEKGTRVWSWDEHQAPYWFPQLPLPLSGISSAVNRLRLFGKTVGFQTSVYTKCKKSGCRGECLWGGKPFNFIFYFIFPNSPDGVSSVLSLCSQNSFA